MLTDLTTIENSMFFKQKTSYWSY